MLISMVKCDFLMVVWDFYRVLTAANLGGELGNDLGMFTSIKGM